MYCFKLDRLRARKIRERERDYELRKIRERERERDGCGERVGETVERERG